MTHTVAIAGASGYAGGELLRLLSAHPELEVTTVTANANAGRRLGDLQPHLVRHADLVLEETNAETLRGHDVVFLALPHGASAALARELADAALVIDCGADHRLVDALDWAEFYGDGDPTGHPGAWTYGLPELPLAGGGMQRDLLAGASRIAVPGCNVTAITLALAPAVYAGLVDADDVVAVLAVGPSGAGRSLKPELLASELLGSANAYQVGGVHRHTPEIVQNLTAAGGLGARISFTPVLVPMSRGILATATAPLADDLDPAAAERALRGVYEAATAGERFVRLLPVGRFPRTADVLGANTASIGIAVDARARRLVAVCAIDNLVKGTAGAAIQSANLALGLHETLGLPLEGVAP